MQLNVIVNLKYFATDQLLVQSFKNTVCNFATHSYDVTNECRFFSNTIFPLPRFDIRVFIYRVNERLGDKDNNRENMHRENWDERYLHDTTCRSNTTTWFLWPLFYCPAKCLCNSY